jgi:hypothetical protein
MTTSANYQTPEARLRALLQVEVMEFDNQHKPLVPTLLRIAGDYHLPMGIEKVVREAVEESITVKLEQGTVATLLDLAIGQLPGYSWATGEGTVEIYGLAEFNEPTNLLNQTVPLFSVHKESLDDANMRLQRMFFVGTQNPSGAYAGSYIGTPQLEGKLIGLSVRNCTIRSILNRLAAQHGEVVWITRVTPERLSLKPTPSAGLWRFLPRQIQDTQGLLDIK